MRGITLDVSDLDRGEAFWGDLLGLAVRLRRERYVWFDEIAPGIQLVLQQVADSKTGKNRMHLDIDSDRPGHLVSRVEALGGSRVTEIEEDDYALTVVADPDGNEFCILNRRSAGFAAATGVP